MPPVSRSIGRRYLFGLLGLAGLCFSAPALATPVNVALNQPVSASSIWADACAAAKANNGSDDASDNCGGWSPSGSDTQPWLQIDLGSPKQISTLELVTRQNCCDQSETRQSFEIHASNDPTFASYVVLGSQAASALPFKATWTKTVSDTNSYRYIRATKAGYFFIAELRVWSEPVAVPPSGNLALNRPVSASSVYADICAAAKANDGSDNVADSCGGWSPSGADAQSWWQVDLGSAYAIGSIELVTRQNCCDDAQTRQNFEIRASNDPNFASSVVLGNQGSTSLPFKATWTQSVSDTNGYRYLRATKPGYFFIAELRVFPATGQSNQAPSISLTSPANSASFNAPANITLSASATDPDGTIAKVEFYNGTSLIATDSNAADGWGITWSAVPPGSYGLSAKAFDNSNASTSSAIATVTVNAASTATNLALNRPATASSQWADICAAAKANNGSDDSNDSCGGWSPTGADTQPWWQVDLGQAYTLTTLELVTRQNCCDEPATRQNFEIRASNDPSFASSVVLGSQGSTSLPFKAIWTQSVSDTNGYRYVRATKSGYFFIAELRVFGNPPTTQPAGNLYYIYPDHLNTARVITNTANTILWRNDQADPFAASVPNEDPDQNGAKLEFNLRFPGQYYDQETGLHYNMGRDYSPGTGRYIQPDPLGLDGGDVSLYTYAGNDPISFYDPEGLSRRGGAPSVRPGGILQQYFVPLGNSPRPPTTPVGRSRAPMETPPGRPPQNERRTFAIGISLGMRSIACKAEV